jgi:hypothetical protein
VTRTLDSEVVEAAAVGLRAWISSGACQSPNGAFVAWVDLADGGRSYDYPEISGYALTYLASLPSLSQREEAAGHDAADWLSRRVQAGNLAARDGWDNDAVYLFDLGMIASGLLSFGRVTQVERYVENGLALVSFLGTELSSSASISPLARRGPRSEREGWSTRGVAHLGKLVQSFLLAEELGGGAGRSAPSRLIDAVKARQSRDGRIRTDDAETIVMLHPHLYAVEGLWIWGQATGDDDALERARAAVEWVWTQQLEQGGLPSSVQTGEAGAAACEQSDVTTQAFRVALALGPPSAAPTCALARILAVAQRHDGGLGIVYQPDSPDAHLNTWATLFAAQALALGRSKASPISWDQLV